MKNIYDNTHFKINHCSDVFDFTIDTLPLSAPFDTSFAILTAHNPKNTSLSQTLNDKRNGELFSTLMETNYGIDSALGYLDDHSEESYCIYGIGFGEAMTIARDYDQYTFFYADQHRAGYYESSSGEPVTQRLIR